ncbi:phage integrase family protein [Streptomyces xiamenensis]|uniref:Phage integrase family protein n=1 Tax=Streptomyces xiamenensis TaxID=408015 RepID=A0A0F7FY80_9ACTN|nr:phage integrase family protein [Streptomyces xiamenensis]
MKSYKVVIWKLSVNRSAKKPTHLVRWSVDGGPFHESHRTKALADRFRAKLLRAADKGEAFDTVTGLPDSLRGGKVALSFVELAVKYLDARWAEASAKQRDSMTARSPPSWRFPSGLCADGRRPRSCAARRGRTCCLLLAGRGSAPRRSPPH